MTLGLSLAVSSAFGAILFFMAGLLVSWRRPRPNPESLLALEQEAELLKEKLEFAEKAVSDLRTNLESREVELSSIKAEAAQAVSVGQMQVAIQHEEWEEKLRRESLEHEREREAFAAEQLRVARENGMLRKQLEDVRSALPPEIPASRVVRADAASARQHGFQDVLSRLENTRGVTSGVLVDDLGLPIAAFGESSDALAGYTGFLMQIARKATEYLPLDGVCRITVEDGSHATLSCCSIPGTPILLATMTSGGPGPEAKRMLELLDEAVAFAH